MSFGTVSPPRPKLFLLILGYCDSCLNSPKNPSPGEGGSDGGQEKRKAGDTDELAETVGGAEPWREKDLGLHFISKSSITKIFTFPSNCRGAPLNPYYNIFGW